jgi:hypothetical protein
MTASLLARLKGLKQKVKTKLKTKLSRSKNKTTSFVPAGTDAARTVDLVYPVDTNTKPDTQVNALNLTLDTPTRSFVAWPRSRPQPFEVQSRPRVYIPDLKVDTNTNVNAPEDDYYYLPLSPNATGTRLTDTEDNMPLSMLNTKTKQNEFADYVPAMAAYAAGTVADYDSDSEDEDADGPVNIITAFKPDVPTARLTTITTTTAVMTTIALVPTTIPMTATTPNANAQTSTSNGRAPQRATTYTSTPVSQQTFHRVSIQETVPLRRSLLSPKRLGITLRLKKGNKANTIDTNTAVSHPSIPLN